MRLSSACAIAAFYLLAASAALVSAADDTHVKLLTKDTFKTVVTDDKLVMV
jgi:hypothetical protein